jgi:hypothetical protein
MREITVIGSSLFEIAAAHLGSPLQWVNIAQANQLSDPMLSGRRQIIIPVYSASCSDGIGTQ